MISTDLEQPVKQLTEAKQSENYTGYDFYTGVRICTPTYYGFGVCIGATAKDGYVVLALTAKTPLGDYNKNFKITKDISFTWQPLSRFKVTVEITNFKDSDGDFSFDVKINACGKIPFLGWKCKGYSHHFSIPNQTNVDQLSDHEFAALVGVASMEK